jgi:hypothetical protein
VQAESSSRSRLILQPEAIPPFFQRAHWQESAQPCQRTHWNRRSKLSQSNSTRKHTLLSRNEKISVSRSCRFHLSSSHPPEDLFRPRQRTVPQPYMALHSSKSHAYSFSSEQHAGRQAADTHHTAHAANADQLSDLRHGESYGQPASRARSCSKRVQNYIRCCAGDYQPIKLYMLNITRSKSRPAQAMASR